MSKAGRPNASERYNFLMPLIGFLMRNDGIKISAVAAHFEVSEQYVREAITTLNSTASQKSASFEETYYYIDIEEDGSIYLSQADVIEDAPRLSARQASAIAAGLGILSALPEFSSEGEIAELLDILARGTTESAPAAIHFRPGTVDADAAEIRRAMLNNHRIECEYRNIRGEQSVRQIDPIRLDPHGDIWYLRGYCLTNKQLRNFRLDHMRAATELDIEICEEAKAIQEIDDEAYIASASDVEVTVELDPEAQAMLGDFAATILKTDSKNNTVTALIKIGYLPYLGKVIAQYGGAARVLSPDNAKQVVRNYALTALGLEPEGLPEQD
jgi:proteasome accessory factor C